MKKRTRTRYTVSQLEFLQAGYRIMKLADLTRAFNRRFRADKSEVQINSALKNHSITCGRAHKDRLIQRLRIYTKEQVIFLRENYRGRSLAELNVLFNASFNTAFSLNQIRSAVSNRHFTSGRTGWFEKGHEPWNTGTKGLGLTGANSGSFKKGSVSANRKPIGTERINVYGYIEVKVQEQNPYTGHSTRYKLKHVHLWEQAHGAVPKGMVVAFIDGNPLRCVTRNIMMIPRSLLLELNRRGYKDAPEELKPSMLALAKLKVTAFRKQKHGGKS